MLGLSIFGRGINRDVPLKPGAVDVRICPEQAPDIAQRAPEGTA